MSLGNWRDLATILLVIEAFVIILVPGIILYFAVRGMLALNRKMAVWLPQLQSYFYRAHEISRKISDKIAAPVLAVDSAGARVKGMKDAVVYIVKKQEV